MISNPVIKIGICVAYDWYLLKHSLPRIYPYADLICLGLDKNRKSWSGNSYVFDDEAFYSFVKQIDVDKKIILLEEDFALADLNARQNCNRHRMMIAERMGTNGWHIQVDSDEYFLNFGGFKNYLLKLNPNPSFNQKPVNVCCPFLTLFKKTDNGYIYIKSENVMPEVIPVATNKPDYQRARQNGHFNHYTDFWVIHESWARDEEEMYYKINNWGHSSEELEVRKARESYYRLWKSIDSYNYQYLANFHPAKPEVWEALAYTEGKTIDEFINNLKSLQFPMTDFQIWLKNNRNIARFKHFISKLGI